MHMNLPTHHHARSALFVALAWLHARSALFNLNPCCSQEVQEYLDMMAREHCHCQRRAGITMVPEPLLLLPLSHRRGAVAHPLTDPAFLSNHRRTV